MLKLIQNFEIQMLPTQNTILKSIENILFTIVILFFLSKFYPVLFNECLCSSNALWRADVYKWGVQREHPYFHSFLKE